MQTLIVDRSEVHFHLKNSSAEARQTLLEAYGVAAPSYRNC